MFLRWVEVRGLLKRDEGADPLAVFSPSGRRTVCRSLVADVASSPARLAAAVATEPQLAWLLSGLGHALTLPLAGDTASVTVTAEDMGHALTM